MENSTNEDCPLKQAEKIELEAKEFGFYWENPHQLIEQIRSECIEIHEVLDKDNSSLLQEEIGDLILAAASLAVFCRYDPHETLLKSIKKFRQRYDVLVDLVQKDGYENLREQSFDVLMSYWKNAKVKTRENNGDTV